jgi:drug/metabolite transporter (DMT)-like permease
MTHRPGAEPVGATAVATAVLMSAMWGANVVGTKIALEAIPPIWNAAWRMALGLPFLLLWARAGGVDLWPDRSQWRPLALLSVLFAVQIMLMNLSIQLTSAAYSAVLVNAAPILTNVIAHFYVADDRLSRTRVLGLAIAFAGVASVLSGRPEARFAPAPLLGNILALLTAILIGVRMVFTQRLVQSVNSTKTIVWQVSLALPIFVAGGLLFEPGPITGEITPRIAVALLYCGVGVVGVAFILWVRLLQKHPPGLISVFAFGTPLFGVLFSALLFGERISPSLGLGVAAVAAGVLLVTLEKRKAANP